MDILKQLTQLEEHLGDFQEKTPPLPLAGENWSEGGETVMATSYPPHPSPLPQGGEGIWVSSLAEIALNPSALSVFHSNHASNASVLADTQLQDEGELLTFMATVRTDPTGLST